jgi:hypothetical protein
MALAYDNLILRKEAHTLLDINEKAYMLLVDWLNTSGMCEIHQTSTPSRSRRASTRQHNSQEFRCMEATIDRRCFFYRLILGKPHLIPCLILLMSHSFLFDTFDITWDIAHAF